MSYNVDLICHNEISAIYVFSEISSKSLFSFIADGDAAVSMLILRY